MNCYRIHARLRLFRRFLSRWADVADERRWSRQVKRIERDGDQPGRWVDPMPKSHMTKPFVRVAYQHPFERILERLEAAKPSAAIYSITGARR